jgi:pimeloyl-ACP methyl ester carboxylesterase
VDPLKNPLRRVFLIAPAVFASALFGAPARAQDYAREQRWADEILATLVVGEAVHIEQKNGHRFLGLYTRAAQPRGAAIIAHGRGWSPDYELYGVLRVKLAEAGYSTLSIQMPVLDGTAKLGDYLPVFPDSDERLALAARWLGTKGYRNVAIVSHSLGATMANHYLARTPAPGVGAWVFIGIINGLEDMFRIQIPVLDVFGSEDWHVTRLGADERLKQIRRIAGSEQVIVAGAQHFFEGRHDELNRVIVDFLDRAFKRG